MLVCCCYNTNAAPNSTPRAAITLNQDNVQSAIGTFNLLAALFLVLLALARALALPLPVALTAGTVPAVDEIIISEVLVAPLGRPARGTAAAPVAVPTGSANVVAENV